MMSKEEDFAVIDRALAGNEQAYEELFNKYQSRIKAQLLQLTHGNITVSEDLLQETFASAFAKLNTFKKKASFGTWLHIIALNAFRMTYRRKKINAVPIECLWDQKTADNLFINGEKSRDEVFYDIKPGEIGGLDRNVQNVPNKLLVKKLMQGLPRELRENIELFDFQGFGHKEIAKMFGFSESASKSRHIRAILKMRQNIKALYA